MSKRKLLVVVLLILAVLAAVFLLRSCSNREADLSTSAGRQSYLRSLGWDIDTDSEEYKRVRLPNNLDGVLADYNAIQLEQGCDLSKHLGEACDQYSYAVLNYPDPEQTVRVTLYIQGGKLIAGDVHSTALDGFMQGLAKP